MAKKKKKTGELPEILTNSKFYVELSLDDSEEIDAFFMDCSGMNRSLEVIELAEVTPNKWGKGGKGTYGRIRRTKLPGNVSSSNITLKRGLCNSTTIWDWFTAVAVGRWYEKFRDGDITIYDQGHIEQARFRFTGAWPSSYTIGDLAAGGNELEIEEVELVVAQFYRVSG
jgi:phage tail-like protein